MRLTVRLAAAAGLLAAALLTAGCAEIGCEEVGCDPGFVCDESSGRCVEQIADCHQDDCPSDQVCNRQTGECEPETQSCENRPCPRGQVCNGATGYCRPDTRCSDDECGAAERCDEQAGECRPKSCEDDSQCPAGYICGTSGECTAGCRPETPNCPFDQSCWRSSPSTGQCRDECSSDTDCPHGQACTSSTGQPVCRPEPPCSSNTDCRDDEVCRDGQCAAPPCESNAECPNEQVCDRATGICVGGECTEDDFGPNQTPGEATELHFETFTDLQLCPGRSDWFALEVEAGQGISVQVAHAADRDLDFVIFDDRGDVVALNQQAPARQTGRTSSEVTFVSARSQTLRIRIYSTSRRSPDSDASTPPVPSAASYDLAIRHADELLCRDDRWEDNDTRRSAEPLSSSIGASPDFPFLQICGADEDWFELPDLPRRARMQVRLRDAESHFELDVYSEQGAHFRRSPVEAFQLWRNGDRQDWFLRVHSRRDRSGGYTLGYSIDAPWNCPNAGEADDADSAAVLPPDEAHTRVFCPLTDRWEDDWIALEAPSSKTYLEVRVTERAAIPPVEVRLYERDDDSLTLLRTASRHGGVHGAALEVEPSREILVRLSTDATPGTLTARPEYEITYAYQNGSE